MNEDLLMTALSRRGAPSTAAEVFDMSVGLAMSAGWPRRTWEQSSVKTVSRLLQSMANRSQILRFGMRKEGGREVPLYGLATYQRDAPLPPQPDLAGTDHPLVGMTAHQRLVLFDAQDAMLQALHRQRTELHQMVDRHMRELSDLTQRQRHQLLAAGLEGA